MEQDPKLNNKENQEMPKNIFQDDPKVESKKPETAEAVKDIFQDSPKVGKKPAKSKKTMIIVGSIIGLLAICMIGPLIWWFAVYQNPERVITDSLINYVNAENVEDNFKAVADIDSFGKIEISGKSQHDKENAQSKVEVSIIGNKDGIDINTKVAADVFTLKNGDIYLRLSNLNGLVDKIADAASKGFMKASNGAITNDNEEIFRRQITKVVSKVAGEFDGKWLKMSKDDYYLQKASPVSAEAGKCLIDVRNALVSDKAARNDLLNKYRKNPFIISDGTAKDDEGAIGYKVKVDEDKLNKWIAAIDDNAIVNKIKKCRDGSSASSSEYDSHKTKSTPNNKFSAILWADYFSHKLRKMQIPSDPDNSKDKGQLTLNVNYPSKVEIQLPTDTTSMKDAVQRVQTILFRAFTGGIDSE